MPAIQLRILDRDIRLECAAHEQRRLEDLAAALNVRLTGFSGDADGFRRLALTALSLLDETQAKSAALMRARGEIERLTDMLVESRLPLTATEPGDDDRGRLASLSAAPAARGP